MRLLTICLALVTALPADADKTNKGDHARVLIVTGVDHPGHHWRETAPALRKVLEQDKRFDVRIVEDPDFLGSSAVSNYDVILLHFKNYASLPHESQSRENLEKPVKQGKGLVLIHFASGTFED